MKKRIIRYRQRIDELLESSSDRTDGVAVNWDVILEEHLTQIAFFQHERLVHLIVTMTVAILMMLSIAIVLVTCFLPMLAVTGLFLVLLVPYILHYYTLENEVQKMYEQYDQILKLRK